MVNLPISGQFAVIIRHFYQRSGMGIAVNYEIHKTL